MTNKIALVTLGLQLLLCPTRAQLLAFPTAEGAGKFTTGGRGTVASAPVIYEVTNLTDVNSPGSFRYACTNGSAARLIVFRVSGTIHLNSALSIKANTTIAGQTAPGEGICLADYPVTLGGNNIIVRYIRFRLGDKNQAANLGNDDAFGDNSANRSNIIIDHCTMSWSNDEAFTVYHGDKITLQWNFITEPLDKSYHDEGSGVQNHAYGGIQSGKQISIHHNLYAHLRGRAPRFDGIRGGVADTADYRNNIIYNWADYNVNGGEGGSYNIVNNYYKYGPSTPNTNTSGVNRRNMLINPYKQTSPAIAYGKYFLTGNYCDNSTAVTARNWLGAAFNSGSYADSTASQMTSAFNHTPISIQSAQEAYNAVLLAGGCSLPMRDTLDQRIVNDVINRTGKLIDCQGGYPSQSAYALSQSAWPNLTNGTAQTDTDHDGMPDNWEIARQLNPNDAADRNNYQSTSGYNNIENYLNGDTTVAVGITNSCITAKPITASGTAQWLFARDTTYSGYLNPRYTAATDSNHIVAGILDNGNWGEFTVSYYTTNANRNSATGYAYARRNITLVPNNPALITQPVKVRLYLSAAELDALKLADPTITSMADIQVLQSNDNNCPIALSTAYTVIVPNTYGSFGTYQNGYYIEFETSSFGTFFFQSKSVPVPVQLSVFTAIKKDGHSALLQWRTEQETNSRDFWLQRHDGNGNWQTIATIAAAGNTHIPQQYTYTDGAITNKGTYYYRLVQNDKDGKQAISATRKLYFETGAIDIQVYPNPSHDHVTISVGVMDAFSYTLFNASGQKLHAKTGNRNSVLINTAGLKPGVYQLNILIGNERINKKLFVQ